MVPAVVLPPHTDARGFTLLETLVVLAITGLIAALIFPSLEKATYAIQLRSARQQVSAGIEAARAQAQRSGLPVAVAAMPQGRGLALSDGSTFPLVGTREVPLAGSLTVTVKPEQIVFYPDGSALPGEIALRAGDAPVTYSVSDLGRFTEAGAAGA